VPGLGCLTTRNSCGDNDIPKVGPAATREGEHVGRPVFSAVSTVQRTDGRVADERDGDLPGCPGRSHRLQPLREPGGTHGTAVAVRDGDPHALTVWIHRTIRTP